MSSSIAATRSPAEAQRLDGAGALDGLGEGGVDAGVRRALAQVAVLGAGEVPPQPDHQRRHAEQAGQRDPPADPDRGDEGEHRGDDGDRPLGQRPAHRPAELVDVAAGPGQQVAGAGRLDDADRQRERVVDEVLAQLGQHLLAEHLASVARVAGQHGLQRAGSPPASSDDLVDVATVVPFSTASTSSPSRRGAARAARAARTCRASARPEHRGCRRASCRRSARTARASATGSAVDVLIARPPPGRLPRG